MTGIRFSLALSNKFRLLDQRLETAQAHVMAELQGMTLEAAESFRLIVMARSPVSKSPDGGRLKRAWQVQPGGLLQARVTNDTPYLKFVMRGHGWIYPVRARVLRFQVWPGGQVVFARRVKPVAPNPFVDDAKREFTHGVGPEILHDYGVSLGHWWLTGISGLPARRR